MIKKLFCLTSFAFILMLAIVPALAQQRFVANLAGTQVVPAVNSNAKGVCSIVLNQTETQISLTCNYSDFSVNPTAAHIHGNAAAGANAPVLFNLNPTGGASGNVPETIFNLSAAQVAELKAQRLYIDFHTGESSTVEIRGQIKRVNNFSDVDGDGRSDLEVYRPSNNIFYVQRSLDQQNGSSASFLAQQFGQSGDFTGTADFDGDGRADLIALRPNLSSRVLTWFILQSSNNTIRSIQWGDVFNDSPAPADFDGDGKVDIAVYRRFSGIWYIIESSTNLPRYEYFGNADDTPVPGDYDKDGKNDIAVVRAENGQSVWYLKRSSDNALRRVAWGLDSDNYLELLPVDVDGDGAFDRLVYRDGADGKRTFYALRSSDNQMFAVQWGLNTDTPLVGDYDGDGKTDFVARRDAGGRLVWYILQSSDNQFRTAFWGLTGDQ